MTGGLIQLVSHGIQDIFLTTDPQITFFKAVYRRYTNFTIEAIPLQFLYKPDFGKRVTCMISRNGDLIGKMYIVIDLPAIPEFRDDDIIKFAWVRKIGYAIIKQVEIEIGDALIDRQYGDWLNIWSELTTSNYYDINAMIGNVKELIEPTNGKRSYRLYIPLQFWFNKTAGLALPIVALQYDYIKLNLDLSEFNKCINLSPTHYITIDNDIVNLKQNEYLIQKIDNNTINIGKFIHYDILTKRLYYNMITDSGFTCNTVIYGMTTKFEIKMENNTTERLYINRTINFKNICLKNCFILAEYIFLDSDERTKFAKAKHEYLIEQLAFDGSSTINSSHQSYRIGFINCCKKLLWVTQLSQSIKNHDYFNYTDNLIRDCNGNLIGKNMITSETILFNSNERLSYRNSQYFNWIQPYQYFTHSPPEGINIYSFSLYPDAYQPAGSANLSKIDNVDLKISVNPKICYDSDAVIRIYGVMYNIFRIVGGISGLVFSTDY